MTDLSPCLFEVSGTTDSRQAAAVSHTFPHFHRFFRIIIQASRLQKTPMEDHASLSLYPGLFLFAPSLYMDVHRKYTRFSF